MFNRDICTKNMLAKEVSNLGSKVALSGETNCDCCSNLQLQCGFKLTHLLSGGGSHGGSHCERAGIPRSLADARTGISSTIVL